MATLRGCSYTETALSSLEKIQPAKVRRQIRKKIDDLLNEPHPPGSRKIRGTRQDEDVYRIRSGDYRVLYQVRGDNSEIVILDIGHRKDVYRGFQ